MICAPIGAIVALVLAMLCVMKVVSSYRPPSEHITSPPFYVKKDQSRVPHTYGDVVVYYEED